MKLSAIKKADGSIWLAHGDASRAMEEGDMLIELPADWEAPDAKYRDCWAEKNGDIVVDLPKARAQKLEEVRAARDAKLVDSDKEWMIASSSGAAPEAIAAINAKKAALRDLPDAAEAALKKLKKLETIDAYEPDWS